MSYIPTLSYKENVLLNKNESTCIVKKKYRTINVNYESDDNDLNDGKGSLEEYQISNNVCNNIDITTILHILIENNNSK